MFNQLKCTQFRNFHSREFFFDSANNFIIWENGKGKTNLLEALALLTGNSILWIHFDMLVETWYDFFHLELTCKSWDVFQIFYDASNSKRKYSLNWKTTTKKKFMELSCKSVLFSPMMMNILYLWPSPRRDYIDSVLQQSYSDFWAFNKKFKQCITQRNKILKNISLWFSKKEELYFWDEQFIILADYIYKKRAHFINFLSLHKKSIWNHLCSKIPNISIQYNSKIDLSKNIPDQLQTLLDTNLQKDILLKTTTIWPHRDDVNIVINNNNLLTNFASRWEVKTTILNIKQLEIQYIEEITQKKPLLIIDDLLSELDDWNKAHFLKQCHSHQTFISSIEPFSKIDNFIELR